MPPKDEPKMVAFKDWALKFGEDIDGKGGTVDSHAVEKSLHKLKDGPIGLSFDGRKRVGVVKHLRQFPEGIEAEGLIREDLLSKGRPALAGKIEKTDEDDEQKILEWDLNECGWLLKENDPRETGKGADPKRLKAVEQVAWLSGNLRDMLNPETEPWTEEAKNKALADFDKAVEAWNKAKD